MNIEIKSLLYDILNAINEIDSFFLGTPKNFLAFQKDVKTKELLREILKSLEKQ